MPIGSRALAEIAERIEHDQEAAPLANALAGATAPAHPAARTPLPLSDRAIRRPSTGPVTDYCAPAGLQRTASSSSRAE